MKLNYRFLPKNSLANASGGLLFGFNSPVISGKFPFIEDFFGLSETMKGCVVSVTLSSYTNSISK